MRILIVKGEDQFIRDISFCLQVRYPDTTFISSANGRNALEILETELPDIIFLGSNLADIPILDLIARIRRYQDVPLVIMIEEQNELRQAELLEAGADEFVLKNFSPIEFLARISSLMRRTQGPGSKSQNVINVGKQLSINHSSHEVICSGNSIHLTPIEYNLLSELVTNQGTVLTHKMLLEKIWGPEYDVDSDFIKKYIHRLRSKLEPDCSNPRMILNERGIGYKFVNEI